MGRAARRRARRPAPPLPQREGLDPVRWRIGPDGLDGPDGPNGPDGADGETALQALARRFPALLDPSATPLAERFGRGDMVRSDGTAWRAEEPAARGEEIWFHRELREELITGPDPAVILHDAHLLVLDKPHDMATMPRGAHVRASALVRMRRSTGIASLSPLHRLDRRTAGVLALGVATSERAAYQGLFARGEVHKEYLARVVPDAGSSIPTRAGERFTLRDRLEKHHGELRTRAIAGEPNARTDAEVLRRDEDRSLVLRLHPRTGRTHQLRAQLALRGAPIAGDDLYPHVRPADQVEGPLALLAARLAFTDPLTGRERDLRSTQELP